MSFPVPLPSTALSSDTARDAEKRLESPPSSFFAQSQGILNAVIYFDPLHSGYAGAAGKHKIRMWSALFVQLMATFEFTMKDFIAQTLDATYVYDDDVKAWPWLELDLPRVLSMRDGVMRLGSVLIHPLAGWQTPETMNLRYQNVYGRKPIANDEIGPLSDLWIVRHSVAHNGGVVTGPDAARLRDPALANNYVRIDLDYLKKATEFLRVIVARLETVVGPSLLKKWFGNAATRTWSTDEADYRKLKLLTTYVQSRTQALPAIDEAAYQADLAQY